MTQYAVKAGCDFVVLSYPLLINQSPLNSIVSNVNCMDSVFHLTVIETKYLPHFYSISFDLSLTIDTVNNHGFRK